MTYNIPKISLYYANFCTEANIWQFRFYHQHFDQLAQKRSSIKFSNELVEVLQILLYSVYPSPYFNLWWKHKNKCAMSCKNLFLPYANNECADQSAHPHSLISIFVVHCLDSIIALLAIAEIPRLYIVASAEQAGLGLTWSKTPKTGFLIMRLKWFFLWEHSHAFDPCIFFSCFGYGISEKPKAENHRENPTVSNWYLMWLWHRLLRVILK